MKSRVLIAFLTAAVLLGCQSKTSQNESPAQDLAPLDFTLYTDKTELFVEFKPLVAGQQSKFAAHFTELGSAFKPLTEGAITVSLIVDGKGIRNTVNAASSPGIFRLALTPKQTGKGQLIFDIVTKDYTDRIVINDITVYADDKTALANQKEDTGAGEISYLKEQAWKIEFANSPVERKTFHETIKTSGQLLGAPGDEVTLIANTSGVVKLSGQAYAAGVPVRRGQSLFTVSGAGVTENNIDVEIRNARAELNKAKEDFNRANLLIKDQLMTRGEFTEAKLRYENARITLNSLTRNYGSNGKSITSPMSGFIKTILVTEGAFVETGQPLAIVSKNQNLILRAEVAQQYYSLFNQIKEANFTTSTTGDEIFTTQKFVSAGRSTVNSPYIPVTFTVNNSGKLVSGALVEVFLKSSPIANAIAIPVSSLVEEQGNLYVYVQTAGESFEKREVKTGSSDGVEILITSGLTEGERVVTKGANQIKISSMSGAVPAHGHEH
jgi:membrane fusion protein, heavy metal efflux system